jgi:hypothetical protein
VGKDVVKRESMPIGGNANLNMHFGKHYSVPQEK